MTDTTDEAELLITLHGKLDGGGLTEPIATATIASGDAVLVRGPKVLPMPLVLVAPPELLSDPEAGRAVEGGRAFEVASVHMATGGLALEDDLEDDGVPGPSLAIEIEQPVLRPTHVTHSARSVWCLLFPRLQACQPNR